VSEGCTLLSAGLSGTTKLLGSGTAAGTVGHSFGLPCFWLRLSSPAAELDTLDGLCGLEGLAVAKGSGKTGGLCDVMGLALSKGSGEIGGLWVGNLTGMGGKRLG
jgi:hypothetical protein